jgi:AraC family transcriptional regulator
MVTAGRVEHVWTVVAIVSTFRRFTLISSQKMTVTPVDPSSQRIGTFSRFLRGESSMRFSTRGLHWTFIDLESHLVPPREVPEGMTGHLLLIQWQGNSVARGDYPISRGCRVPYAKRPTTTLPSCRATAKFDALLGAKDKDFFNKVFDEMKQERIAGSASPGGPIASDQPGFHHVSRSTIMQLLRDEAKSGGLSGALYEEHLTHALAARLLTLMNRSISAKNHQPAGDLHPHLLNQIIDRIEANPLEDFNLAILAAELSPYRYIMRLRLSRAKRLMRNRSLTFLEIAIESGFASHAHFTYAFRQHVGCAPSQFRAAL